MNVLVKLIVVIVSYHGSKIPDVPMILNSLHVYCITVPKNVIMFRYKRLSEYVGSKLNELLL